MIEESRFLRHVTQSLYSSLEIGKALHETVICLKNYLPLDLIHVFILDTGARTLRYLAEASEVHGVLIDDRIQLNPSDFTEFRELNCGEVFLLTRSASAMLRKLHTHFISHVRNPLVRQQDNFSVMMIGFDIGAPLIGGFGMVAVGRRPFKEEHMRLISLARRPLTGAVINLLSHRDVVSRNERLSSQKKYLEHKLGHLSACKIIGAETGLKEVMEQIRLVAPLESPVLILGETGTGKEVIANALHQASGRPEGPIIGINCGAIPEGLMDSELFGHEKGAFTGASQLKRGFFEQADGGTIFLDEVGELPLSAQVRLLRVIQTLTFHRVGGNRSISVNVRILAATNRNLAQRVRENRFREDLWFRLNVFPISIPPLRNRKGDIPALAEYFAVRKAREMNMETSPRFSKEAFGELALYDWPGNIRELQNVIERAVIVSRGRQLSFPNLSGRAASPASPASAVSWERFPTMDEMMIRHIRAGLELSGGKVEGRGGAAELLGMNPSTLRSRMKKLGIRVGKKVEADTASVS
ncbi:Fis family transcriptional regulator [Desulfonema ishimotonii]|uniref:Fis family transcriptional regulator n=1 Tax=Desulfonema ishimotonii TaxID=45657 RepID=A0A401FW29_9BACT|nr:sigma 54-interacting transcriptional regulator [Desulfonema ishimotonii]GBC61177.1 Fis family transcriptional regulator [Desulfonema ishimotonii]